MLTRISDGDADGRFEALYRKHYPRVYRFYRSYAVADAEAQDLAQETFRRIFESFGQYRGEAEWAFIETTARNVLFNFIRAGKTAKRSTADTVAMDDPGFSYEPAAPAEPDYAQRQEDAQRKAQMWAAIAELPDGQRQCMELWLGDAKYQAIAKTLGISVDAVKSRLRDAKKMLRARLGAGLPEDDE
jgi:RNA polymerase sigma-70 factor (ECF subfamily)